MVKQPSDQLTYGMWETFFVSVFVFLQKIWVGFHGWLLDRLLWSLMQFDFVGVKRFSWKAGWVAQTYIQKGCAICQPWTFANSELLQWGQGLGGWRKAWHLEQTKSSNTINTPNTSLSTVHHLSPKACFLLSFLKKLRALGGYLSCVMCPVLGVSYILISCHKEEMKFTCSKSLFCLFCKIGMYHTNRYTVSKEHGHSY